LYYPKFLPHIYVLDNNYSIKYMADIKASRLVQPKKGSAALSLAMTMLIKLRMQHQLILAIGSNFVGKYRL